jgi:chorismate dehydratase
LAKLRISIVQYLNTAPLVWGFTNGSLHGKYELSFTVPSQCAEALRSGAADVAIIPAIEYQRIENLVVLPDLAIASKRRVRSLLLLAKKPMQQVRRMALDRSSRSTQALTRILCAEHWKIAPDFVEADPDLGAMLRDADAALLIGDPALRLALQFQSARTNLLLGGPECTCEGFRIGLPQIPTLHLYDVVEEWRKLTNLPAVLALWAGRKEIVNEDVVADFQLSRDMGLQRLDEISERAANELALPAAQLKRYLAENIDFTLDEENLRGLTAYFVQSFRMGLIPAVSTIAIAAARNKPVRYMDFAFAKEDQGPGLSTVAYVHKS